MKLQINIEKRHLFVLMLVFSALAGVIVMAQTAPNPGHHFNDLGGVAPNCVFGQSWAQCQTANGWGLPQHVAPSAAESFNSIRLGGRQVTDFCLRDGTNCPGVNPVTVFKRTSAEACGNTAFACASQVVGGNTYNMHLPQWRNNRWEYIDGGNFFICSWVLCTQ